MALGGILGGGKHQVGLISCNEDDEGRLVCNFEEKNKPVDIAATFKIVAAVGKNGKPELVDFGSTNGKSFDQDNFDIAREFITKRLLGKA